jgi:magnesium-transporting ATPase (P-type)
VSLAVAAVPEGLPAILSVARWACGGWRRNTIVKRLSSVETLLSASVVCSDQTGTVTEDQRDPRGAPHLRQHPPVPALPAVLDVGEVLTMFLGVVPARGLGLHDTGAAPAMPLLATQIRWINLLTGSALALALGGDPVAPEGSAPPNDRLARLPANVIVVAST